MVNPPAALILIRIGELISMLVWFRANVTPTHVRAIFTVLTCDVMYRFPRAHTRARTPSISRAHMCRVIHDNNPAAYSSRIERENREREREGGGRLVGWSEMIAEFSRPECGGGGEDVAQERRCPFGGSTWISNYLVRGKGERGREEKSHGEIRGLLPASNIVLLLSRDVTVRRPIDVR